MPRNRKPVPAAMRHQIVQVSGSFDDGVFELRTYYGYVLGTFSTRDGAQAYYEWHCPVD